MTHAPYDFLDGRTILVADDNAHMRTLVTTLLTALGRPGAVEQACCGGCALEVLDGRPVDLAILDWRMSPVDGLSLVRTIRARETDAHLPVIMMSGYAEPEAMADMRAAGADHVLAKPLSLRSFVAGLSAATRSARPAATVLPFPGRA